MTKRVIVLGEGGVQTSNIVIVFSSPRADGNSCTIGKAVMDGAMGLSTNLIKVHRLNSLFSVRGCQNCDKCVDSGCYIEDDLKPVLDDIEACDSLVVTIPMYFNGPCAQFKVLLDRLYSHMTLDIKPKFPGKKLVLIITHDDANSDADAELLERQMTKIFTERLGYDLVGVINYRCDRNRISAIEDSEVLAKARALGKSL